MKSCNSALRAIGILIGAWGIVGSVFFTFAFTFREDAWQIFGGTMLIIITLLGESPGSDYFPWTFLEFLFWLLFSLILIFDSIKYFGMCDLGLWSSICEFFEIMLIFVAFFLQSAFFSEINFFFSTDYALVYVRTSHLLDHSIDLLYSFYMDAHSTPSLESRWILTLFQRWRRWTNLSFWNDNDQTRTSSNLCIVIRVVLLPRFGVLHFNSGNKSCSHRRWSSF